MVIQELERRLAFSMTAVDDAGSVTEGSTKSDNVLANDTPNSSAAKPPDVVEISYGLSTLGVTSKTTATINGAYGSLTIGSNGAFTYTPDGSLAASVNATDTFTYKAAIKIGSTTFTDTATLTFTITGVNGAPVAVADTANTAQGTAVTIDVLKNDSDPDGNVLTLVSPTVTSGSGTVEIVGGKIVFTPAANYSGSATISYTVSDGTLTAQSTATVTIAAGSSAPVNTLPATFSGTEDAVLTLTGLSVVDADAASSNITVTLGVTNGSLAVLTGVTGGVTNITGNNSASVTLTGTVTQINTTLAAANGLRFTPTANFNGGVTLTMTASDGSLTDEDTAVITIAAVNDTPVNTLPATFSGTEDTVLALTGLSVADIDAGSSDITVTLSVASGSLGVLTGVTGGVTTITDNNTASVILTGTVSQINATLAAANGLRFTPGQDFNGNVTLTMLTNDGGGTGSGGAKSDTDTATITIAAVNDAPVNTLPATFSGTEDTVLALTGLSVADVDAASSNITVTLGVTNGSLEVLTAVTGGVTNIAGNKSGTVTLTGTVTQINTTLAATNGLRFTPTANFNGDATLTMSSSDGGATGSGGTQRDLGDEATITIAAVNDAPVAGVDIAEVLENGSVTVDVLTNDSDVEDDVLSITGATVSGGSVIGVATVNANGSITFTPAEGYAGPAQISYTLSDGDLTATGSLLINVVGIQPTVSVEGDSVFVAPLQDLPGWSIVPRSAEVIEGTGSVFIKSSQDPPTIEFRPGRGFIGAAIIQYSITDGTDTRTIYIVATVGPTIVIDGLDETYAESGTLSTLGEPTVNNAILTEQAVELDGVYGKFTLSYDGNGIVWSYDPQESNPYLLILKQGQAVYDTFSYTVDGNTYRFVVSLVGKSNVVTPSNSDLQIYWDGVEDGVGDDHDDNAQTAVVTAGSQIGGTVEGLSGVGYVDWAIRVAPNPISSLDANGEPVALADYEGDWIYSGRALFSGTETTVVETPLGTLTLDPDTEEWTFQATRLADAPILVTFGERQPLTSGNVQFYDVQLPQVLTLSDDLLTDASASIVIISDYQSAKLGWDTPIDPSYVNQGTRIQDEVSVFIQVGDGPGARYFAAVLNANDPNNAELNSDGWTIADNGLWQNRLLLSTIFEIEPLPDNLNGNALDRVEITLSATSLQAALAVDQSLQTAFLAGNFSVIVNDETMSDPRLKDQDNYIDQQNPLFGTYQARLVSVGFDRMFSCGADNLDIAFSIVNANTQGQFGSAAQTGATAIDGGKEPANTLLIAYRCPTQPDTPDQLVGENGGAFIEDADGDLTFKVLANDYNVDPATLEADTATALGARLVVDLENGVVTTDQRAIDPDTFKKDEFAAQGDDDSGWGDRSIYDNLRADQILVDSFNYSAATGENVSDEAQAYFYVTGVNDDALISASVTSGMVTRSLAEDDLTAGVYVGSTDTTSGKMLVWDADAFTNGWVFGKSDVFARDDEGAILRDENGKPIRATTEADYREAYLVESFGGDAPAAADGTEPGSKDFQHVGTYGTFTFTYEPTTLTDDSGFTHPDYETGQYTWSYTVDRNNLAVGFLPSGQFLMETLTLTSLDGTDGFTITVDIEGSYVAPARSAPPPEPEPQAPQEPTVAAANPTLETTTTETASTDTANPVLATTQTNSPTIANTINPILSVSQSNSADPDTTEDTTGIGASPETGGDDSAPAPSDSGGEAQLSPARSQEIRLVAEFDSKVRAYTFEVSARDPDNRLDLDADQRTADGSALPGPAMNLRLGPLAGAPILSDFANQPGTPAAIGGLPRFSMAMRDAVAQL